MMTLRDLLGSILMIFIIVFLQSCVNEVSDTALLNEYRKKIITTTNYLIYTNFNNKNVRIYDKSIIEKKFCYLKKIEFINVKLWNDIINDSNINKREYF